jgi:predicted ATPase
VIAIAPLTRKASESLVRSILGDSADDATRSALAQKTGGNPLFIEEVARSMAEAPEGSARSALRIPSTVRDLLASRIDRLAEHVKGVVNVASVIGREFSARLLGQVAEQPDGVPDTLAMLVKVEIVGQTTRDTFAFRYPLAQEVAYEGLLIQRRRLLHARIGRALEEDDPGRVMERAEELAHHFLQAEDWERAVRYLREAARKAAALCSNGDAVTLLGRALEALDRLPESKSRTELAIDLRLDLRPPL